MLKTKFVSGIARKKWYEFLKLVSDLWVIILARDLAPSQRRTVIGTQVTKMTKKSHIGVKSRIFFGHPTPNFMLVSTSYVILLISHIRIPTFFTPGTLVIPYGPYLTSGESLPTGGSGQFVQTWTKLSELRCWNWRIFGKKLSDLVIEGLYIDKTRNRFGYGLSMKLMDIWLKRNKTVVL